MVNEERGPVRPGGPDINGLPADAGLRTDSGGDAACWLGELCPECGAMPERGGTLDPIVPCWRCGTVNATSAEGE